MNRKLLSVASVIVAIAMLGYARVTYAATRVEMMDCTPNPPCALGSCSAWGFFCVCTCDMAGNPSCSCIF
jgi:hypothetical protein